MHPTIYFTKKILEIFSEEREIAMFCDLHGHSIKKNAFMYACSYLKPDSSKFKRNIFLRLIPFLLSKHNPYFSYENSHFRMERSKQSTARIVSFREFKILASYTLEASFFGCDKLTELNKEHHLDEFELESIGRDLCKQLTIFLSPKELKIKLQELSDFLKFPNGISKLIRIPSRKNTNKVLKSEEKLQKNKTPINSSKEILNKIDEVKNQVEEDEENLHFTIQKAINELKDENIAEIYLPDEKSDSGGSDSQASLNDEKKIKFLLKKKKSKKKRKHSEGQKKGIITSQNSNFSQARSSCLTPDLLPKNGSKSRISMRKKSELLYKNIIPSRIMLRSPFLEENIEDFRENHIKSVISAVTRSNIIKENKSIKVYRGVYDNYSYMKIDDSQLFLDKSLKKIKNREKAK